MGVPAVFISVVAVVTSRLLTKILYVGHPDFGNFTMLAYRAVISALTGVIYLNRDFKLAVWDSLERSQVKGLTIKVIHGNIGTILMYSSLYYWPMTLTSTARNITPFVVLIMSYFFLAENTSIQ